MRTTEELMQMQALPLDVKILKTQQRVREWVEHFGEDNVYVSFSGGKDSTVLLHLVRQIYPNIKAVFSDTGLEYPEIRKFAIEFDNVDIVKPKMNFKEVITKYGYPVFSKEVADAIWGSRQFGLNRERRKKLLGTMLDKNGNKSKFNKQKYLPACQELPFLIGAYCCSAMKKKPMLKYSKETGRVPILATLAEESALRMQSWLRVGCNAYEADIVKSQPMSFWTEQDVLQYIIKYGIQICSVYGDIIENGDDQNQIAIGGCGKLSCSGCQRTGCVYCLFGAGNEHKKQDAGRFELLAKTHPQVYDYAMRGGQWIDNPNYDACAPEYDEVDGWKNWNPKKIFVPSKDGLGLKFVIDEINKIYPDFIRY